MSWIFTPTNILPTFLLDNMGLVAKLLQVFRDRKAGVGQECSPWKTYKLSREEYKELLKTSHLHGWVVGILPGDEVIIYFSV